MTGLTATWAKLSVWLQCPWCSETGRAIWVCALREEGLLLFIQLPVTSAHQGSHQSCSRASAGKKVSLLMSQMFYSLTTVCAWQFVYVCARACGCVCVPDSVLPSLWEPVWEHFGRSSLLKGFSSGLVLGFRVGIRGYNWNEFRTGFRVRSLGFSKT